MTATARDSAVNQRICAKLVEREVICCLSSLVHHFATNEAALEGSDYSQEDIMDLCQNRPDHSDRIEEIDDELAELEQASEDYGMLTEDEQAANLAECNKIREKITALEQEQSDLESEQEDGYEVYEHWAVSSWFAGKLKEQGETVGELFNLHVWGRCTTGQSISLDSVIQQIASNMEILEGQKNSWAD